MDQNCVFHNKSLDKLEKSVEVIKDGIVQIRLETAAATVHLANLHSTVMDITTIIKDHETRIKDLRSTADRYSGLGTGVGKWIMVVWALTNALSFAVARVMR